MRVFFEGWYGGVWARATDWICKDLVCVELRIYHNSTRVDSPDVEKVFLLRLDNPEDIRIIDHSIIDCLAGLDEKRDLEGHLVPIKITIPTFMLGMLKGV